MGSRFTRDESPETAVAMARYSARLLSLMEPPPPLPPGKSNEMMPRSLPLSPPAAGI